MPLNLSAPPIQTPVLESPKTLLITKVWENWFRAMANRIQSSAFLAITTISLTARTASIGLTSLIPSASGLYRVSYRMRVTTAAGVSSSIQLTITTTDGGVTCTNSSTAYTGNVTNAPQTGSFVVRCDSASPLSYSTTYASNPATVMQHSLDLMVEQL
jgi:hypothetical protein